EVARASSACSASTRARFCAWNTRRTTASASGEVTRRPSTVRLSIPAAASSASSWGPAPWTTIGVRPTSCRNASEETSAGRSSRSTAPPTLTTAKRAASSWEKRLRYCETSLALPMLDSRRMMVWRVAPLWGVKSWMFMCRVWERRKPRSADDPCDGFRITLQLRERDPLVRGVRLRDVARAVDQCGHAGAREQRGLGPEVHGVADRQAELVGEVARGEPALFRRGDVAGGQRRAAESLLVVRERAGAPGKARVQLVDVVRRQRAEPEAQLRLGRDNVGLDPALDAADVETQSGEPAEAAMRFGFHQGQSAGAPAHRLVQRAGLQRGRGRGVPCLAPEAQQHRADTAVREHRLAAGRLGHDRFGEAVASAQEAGDAARVVGLLVAAEQERGVAAGLRGRGQQAG